MPHTVLLIGYERVEIHVLDALEDALLDVGGLTSSARVSAPSSPDAWSDSARRCR